MDAFKEVAGTQMSPPISVTDPAYLEMIGFASVMGGKSHAVADGQSSSNFDSEVHGSKSAAQRHNDTATMAPTDKWLLHTHPDGTDVTVADYRGRDWAAMDKDETRAAMEMRVTLVIQAIRAKMAMTGPQAKIARGDFKTMATVEDFLAKVAATVMKIAT
jgi:hypothetical protein